MRSDVWVSCPLTADVMRGCVADSAPVEIVARGADAVSAYQMACESGTRAVFRTRLMIVGQDRAGKTSLKRTLVGAKSVQIMCVSFRGFYYPRTGCELSPWVYIKQKSYGLY